MQPPRTGEFGAPRLDIEKLNALDDGGQPAVRDVSLSIRAGEIVGVAGVSGNGQRQLVEVLAGQREAESGEIYIAGRALSRHAARRCAHSHLSVLPEEPLQERLRRAHERRREPGVPRVRPAAVRRRRLVAQPRQIPRGRGAQDRALQDQDALRRYRRSASLSGGNVQRAVLARELAGEVDVLIAANPCFGLDFAAVAEIHAEIMAARNRGAAVLLVSEDLDELLELADRLVVMFHGELVYETRASEADLTEIGRHMAGH